MHDQHRPASAVERARRSARRSRSRSLTPTISIWPGASARRRVSSCATSPKRSSVRISSPCSACASERASSSARMPCGRRAARVAVGKNADVHRLRRHVPQHARGHGQRRGARRLVQPVDQHALRRRPRAPAAPAPRAPRPAAATRRAAPRPARRRSPSRRRRPYRRAAAPVRGRAAARTRTAMRVFMRVASSASSGCPRERLGLGAASRRRR